jgi:hypothetical protein
VVRFSGKEQILSRADLVKGPAKGLSVVMVARLNKCVGYDAILCVGIYGTGDPDHLTVCLDGGSIAADTKKGRLTSYGPSLVDADFRILAVLWDLERGQCRLFENGVLARSGLCATGVSLDQGLFVGGFCGFKSFAAADIAEILLFDRPLADPDRRAVQAYLAGKYKLDSAKRITPLASKVPYAYCPSTNQLEAAVDVAAWGIRPGNNGLDPRA